MNERMNGCMNEWVSDTSLIPRGRSHCEWNDWKCSDAPDKRVELFLLLTWEKGHLNDTYTCTAFVLLMRYDGFGFPGLIRNRTQADEKRRKWTLKVEVHMGNNKRDGFNVPHHLDNELKWSSTAWKITSCTSSHLLWPLTSASSP